MPPTVVTTRSCFPHPQNTPHILYNRSTSYSTSWQ